MSVTVHIDKNLIVKTGIWELTIVVEKDPEHEDGTATVLEQINRFYKDEPQIQYRDWS